jgi:hypothetical protein
MPGKADRAPFAETSTEPTPEPKASTQEVTPPAAPAFRVAPGKSVACLRGQLEGGTEISARDFAGGQDVLDGLVAGGAVVKAP